MASSRCASGKCLTSPGVIQPNNVIMWSTHSMSVTTAMRFHARRCSTPTLRSCHRAPPDMPWNSLITTTNLTSPPAAARSSAGSTTSR